jgi:pantoate kinase
MLGIAIIFVIAINTILIIIVVSAAIVAHTAEVRESATLCDGM